MLTLWHSEHQPIYFCCITGLINFELHCSYHGSVRKCFRDNRHMIVLNLKMKECKFSEFKTSVIIISRKPSHNRRIYHNSSHFWITNLYPDHPITNFILLNEFAMRHLILTQSNLLFCSQYLICHPQSEWMQLYWLLYNRGILHINFSINGFL